MKPTKQQIADILPHVRYEIEHSFIVPQHDPKNIHLRESVFLATMIHARNLLTFFEREKRNGNDDVLCTDFGFKAKPVGLTKENRRRFGKDMMHLTYSRLRHTAESKPWPVVDMLQPLMLRAFEFIDHIIESPPAMITPEEIKVWEGLRDYYRK